MPAAVGSSGAGRAAGGRRGRRQARRRAPSTCGRRRLRCGDDQGAVRARRPVAGTTRVRFAVRRRGDRERAGAAARSSRSRAGPGYGSISSARYYIHMFGPVLARRDLVLVDMRGTGHSRAIDCPKLQQGTAPTATGSPSAPGILGDRLRLLPDLGRRRRHRRRPRARSGSTGSPCTATPTAPSWPSPTPTATATRSPRSCSTAPTRCAARAPGIRACGGTGSARCRSPATAPPRARATRRAAWRRMVALLRGRPAASGRCSTRSPPAATSPAAQLPQDRRGDQRLPATATGGPTSA